MMKEGSGLVAPEPRKIHLSRGEILMLADHAKRRERFRRYSERSDRWGRGLTKNPVLVGNVGEHSCCAYLNAVCGLDLSVDTALRWSGDGGRDIVVNDFVFQVKTITQEDGDLLIRRLDASRRIRGLNCDAFVFAFWREGMTQCHLLGWLYSFDAREIGKHVPGKREAGHWNLKIDRKYLEPMSRMAEAIESRGTT